LVEKIDPLIPPIVSSAVDAGTAKSRLCGINTMCGYTAHHTVPDDGEKTVSEMFHTNCIFVWLID
jgi:hypothetical protein